MLKDMDCQRVPVEGNGHGDGGSFLHRLVMRLYGGGGEQAQDAQDVLQEAVLPTEHLSAPSTEQAPAAPQKKAGHSVNTPTNSLLYALWSEWNDIQVGVNAFDYVLNLPLEDGRNGRQLLNDEEGKAAFLGARSGCPDHDGCSAMCVSIRKQNGGMAVSLSADRRRQTSLLGSP